MLQLRKSSDRGGADHGWLKTQHSFSFANYYDADQMGFRSLRVINEDFIAGGTGFGAHPHRDMEIITYIIKGALEHQDSMGNKAVIQPGEVQRMSAGRGVVHSEYNQVSDQETHLLQIWIEPRSRGGEPGYGQKSFEEDFNTKPMTLVVSGDAGLSARPARARPRTRAGRRSRRSSSTARPGARPATPPGPPADPRRACRGRPSPAPAPRSPWRRAAPLPESAGTGCTPCSRPGAGTAWARCPG